MNKDSIYRLIGYHGEYNAQVKKALKKLLKENHPDHHGDKEIFKLINEVKKELENNQVSYNVENTKEEYVFDDIDYNFCHEMIMTLEKEKTHLLKETGKREQILSEYNEEYQKLYTKSMNIETEVLQYKDHRNKNLNVSLTISIIMMMVLVILSFIWHNTYFYILLGMFVIALILYSLYYQKNNNSQEHLNEYIEVNKKIREINQCKKDINIEILSLQRKTKKVENDLRFYHNLLKYK